MTKDKLIPLHDEFDENNTAMVNMKKDNEEDNESVTGSGEQEDTFKVPPLFRISASEEYLGEKHPVFGGRISVEMKKMHPEAIIIKAGTDDSAAFDFFAYDEFRVEAYSKLMFPTGWAFAIPSGVAGWITPRSGMSHKLTLSINNSPGLIDADYRGQVFITFRNYGENDIVFEKESKVAQFTFIPIFAPKYVNLIEVEELRDTARGQGGFGHTDIKR